MCCYIKKVEPLLLCILVVSSSETKMSAIHISTELSAETRVQKWLLIFVKDTEEEL